MIPRSPDFRSVLPWIDKNSLTTIPWRLRYRTKSTTKSKPFFLKSHVWRGKIRISVGVTILFFI